MKTELDSNRLHKTDYQKRWSRWNESINATAQSFVDELLKMPLMEVLHAEPVVKSKAEKTDDKSEPADEKVDDEKQEKPSDPLCALPVPQQFLIKDDTPSTEQSNDSLVNEDTVTEKPVQAIAADTKKNPEAEIKDPQLKALEPVADKAVPETLEATAPRVAQATEEVSTADAESKIPTLKELFPNATVREKGDALKARNTKEVKSEATPDAAVSEVAVRATAKTDEDIASKIKSHRGGDKGHEAEVKPIEDEPKLNRRSERLASRARNDDRSGAVDSSVSRSESSRDVPAVSDKAASAADQVAPIEVSAASTSPATPTIPTTTSSVTPVPVAATPSNIADVARSANAPGNTADRGASLAGISSTNTTSSSTSGSRAESTRGSIPTSLSRYQETKLVQRVLRGIEQLSNGGGQVRLRLHPQELGTLQMTLRIEGSQMSAKLEVENSTAKEALLQNLQSLRDRLADQGMQVERFEVTVSSQSNSFGADAGLANGNQDRRSWEQQATSRYATQNNNMIASERNTASAEPSRTWSRTNGSLDVKV